MMKHSRMQLLKEYREYSSSRRSWGNRHRLLAGSIAVMAGSELRSYISTVQCSVSSVQCPVSSVQCPAVSAPDEGGCDEEVVLVAGWHQGLTAAEAAGGVLRPAQQNLEGPD